MSRETRWIIATAALLGCGLRLLSLFLEAGNEPGFSDFEVYHRAGGVVMADESPYHFAGHYQYKYAPGIAYLVGITLSPLPVATAGWIFYWAVLIGWLATACALVFYCRTRVFGREGPGPESLIGIALLLLLVGTALRDEMKLGQANLFALVPLVCAWVLLREKRGRSFTAGLVFSFAIQVKLFSLILLPWVVFRKDWRMLAGVVVGYAALSVALPAVFSGPEEALGLSFEWARSLTASSQKLFLSSWNVSPASIIAKERWLELWQIPVAIIAAIVVWFQFSRRHADPWVVLVVSLPFANLINPIVWPYWVLLLAPTLTHLLCTTESEVLERSRLLAGTSLLGISFLVVWLNDINLGCRDAVCFPLFANLLATVLVLKSAFVNALPTNGGTGFVNRSLTDGECRP